MQGIEGGIIWLLLIGSLIVSRFYLYYGSVEFFGTYNPLSKGFS